MRLLFGILVGIEVLLAAAPFVRSGVNRPEASRAWHEWRQNPTPETEKVWILEKARLKREAVILDSVLVVLLVVNSGGLFFVGRRAFRKEPT